MKIGKATVPTSSICTSDDETPEGGRWRTVRSPVTFDGERPLDVTAPPLLGEHNEELRDGWTPRQKKS